MFFKTKKRKANKTQIGKTDLTLNEGMNINTTDNKYYTEDNLVIPHEAV